MSIPVFTSVVYLSPWLPLPPGWSKVGVDATVTAPPSGSNLALAGRLRQGATTLQVQVGASATEVVIVPTAPLSTALDYYIDVQWVTQGTQPGSIVWTTPNTVATSPVVTAIATLASGSIAGTAVSLSWAFGGAAITPAGANLSAYNAAGTSAGFKRVQGTTGTLTLNTQATPTGTTLYLQAVMPISGAPGAGFTAPFSAGPILSGAPLPLAAPALTSAAYDGASAQVAWTAPAAPTTGGTIGYDLAVTAGTAAATMFAAGAGGGMAVLGGTPAGSALSVAGRVRVGAIAGASGTPQALLTLPPLLDQIAISGAAVSVRATFPAGAPAGAVAQLRLMRNGVSMGTAQAATSGATVQIAGLTAALDGWTVQGAMSATVSGAALTGPSSLPLPVPTAAPVIRAIAMTPDPSGSGGWVVTLDASAPPPPDASLSVTLSQSGTTIASQSIADGASASFTLAQGNAAANVIDGTKVANASLAIVTASGTSPAAAATFVGAAPTVTAVQNIGAGDPGGQPQGLQVDASGGVSGQLLALQLTAGGKVVATATGATATHANLPLSQPLDPSLAWFIQARWTGAGVTAATFGGWSAPVAVLTATTNVVSAEYDNKQLILTIAPPAGVAPAQGAYLFAQQVSGGAIKGVSVIGTRGTISVDATAGNWQAGAKPFQPLPSGASSRTLAPSSALAPILTAAPSLATLGYDGASLSASWTIAVDGAGNAATGALLQVSDGVGTISTVAAGSASGEAQIQLPASAQGAATVRVRATRSSSAGTYSGAWSAAIAPLVAAPTLGSVALDAAGTTVNAVLTPPAGVPAGTGYQAWLMAGDRIVAGPVAATTASGTTKVSFAYAALGVANLAVVAQAQASAGGAALTGPRSAPVPVLAFAPSFAAVVVTTASDTTKWQLAADWLAPADGAAIVTYWLKLSNAGGGVVYQAGFGSALSGSLTFDKSGVDATGAYALTLEATSANGSTTPLASATVWFAAAAFTAVATTETQASAQWTAPAGPTGVTYRLRLIDTTNMAVLATKAASGTSGAIDISGLGLAPGGSYALDLGIEAGLVLFQPGSDGTAATRPPLLLSAPTLGTVTLDTAAPSVSAVLTLPAGMPAGTTYSAWLMAGDKVVAGPVTATTSAGVTSASFNYAAAGVAGLAIAAQAQATVNNVALTGPRSAPVPVLALAPTFAAVLVAAASDPAKWQLDASWLPPADSAAIVSYALTLSDQAGGTVAQAPAIAALSGGFAFAKSTVNANAAYTLTLAATSANGSVTPVASASFWFAAAAFTAVATGQAQVSAQWTAPTGPTNVVYQLRLLNSTTGATLATTATSATSGGIDTAALGLQPGGTYALALGIQLGPVLFQPGSDGSAATRPPLLTAAPTVGAVIIDTQTISVGAILTPPAGMPTGTGYQAWLLAGDLIVAGPVDAVTASGATRVSFDYAAAGVAGLNIVAQAQATIDNVALSGPRSAPAPVLAFAPSLAAMLVATASDPSKWQLGAGWIAPADGAAIVTYWLKLSDSAGALVAQAGFGATNAGALSFAKSAVNASVAYILTLQATSANGSTTPMASATLWFASAAFTSVTTGQSQVNAQWTAPAGPVGIVYRLQLLNSANGAVLATTTTSATSGGIDIAGLGLQPGGAYALDIGIQLGIVLFEAGSDGTAKTRPALLLASPLGLTAATNAATGKAVLSWTAVAGASGYTLAFSDGTTASAPGASYAFAAPLAAGEDLRVTITANVVSAGVTSTGPASAPFAMPTLAPALTQADYDGTNVSGAWEPVAGATSYLVTALDAEGAIAAAGAPTAGTSVSFAASLVAADGPFTIVVQAVTEAGTGLPSAPLPVFQTAWFVSTDPPSSEPPNIYPAATLALSPTRISIYLPPLANSTITVAKVGAFDLTSNTDATTKAALPYVLTFAADSNVWAFSADDNPLPAIRPQVQTDYVTFLKAAETAGASSWGISALQLAISRWMPQTFEESHYYAYGLSLGGGNGTGSIDLRQGLVLRVGFANYTNVWSGDTDSWLNGFGGGSPSDFDVADSMSIAGAWQLTMDAFIARLTASGAMSVLPPATLISAESAAGVADAADLFFPSFPNPFYRLFFPGQLENPTGTGSVSTAANFALTSAATYTALGTSSPSPGATTLVAYFRGRAVLRLMIRVRVNDMELVVPLGTTVGNLLDRYGVRPPATQVQLTGVTIERAAGPGLAVFGAGAAPPSLVYDAASRHMVRLDWSTMATYGGPTDATNLPLLHGDRIAF